MPDERRLSQWSKILMQHVFYFFSEPMIESGAYRGMTYPPPLRLTTQHRDEGMRTFGSWSMLNSSVASRPA